MNQSNFTLARVYCKYHEPESNFAIKAKVVACFVLGVCGMFGNLFVIVLAVKYTVKKSLHFLIVNMTVADTLAICFIFCHYVIIRLDQWELLDEFIARILCKVVSFFYFVFLTESLITLFIISIVQYRITRQTVQVARPLQRKHRWTYIFFAWGIPVVLNSYHIIFRKIVNTGADTNCVMDLSPLALTIIYLLYVVAATTCYCAMILLSVLAIRNLSSVRAIDDRLSEVQRQGRRNRTRSIVKMVLFSLLLYSCCYLPVIFFEILRNLKIFDISHCFPWSTWLFLTRYFLPLVNICFSPCIYCVCLPDFREGARKFLWRPNTTNPVN